VSQHIIVRNGGHELLPEPKIQDLVVAFLRDRAVTEATIDLATPDFPDLEAAKRPPRRGP
jgi:hypothetical protein